MSRVRGKLRAVLVAVVVGGLTPAMVSLPATAGGGGTCHDPKPVSASGAAVDAKESCFFPTVLYVEEGATVTWTNRDAAPHSVTGLALGWGTGQKTLSQGGSVSVEFSDPGVYPYTCILHPGMVGAVVVGEPTAAEGAAESTSVPIGRPAPSESAADETAPAKATLPSPQNAVPWPGLIAGAVVVGALMFVALRQLKVRRLRQRA
jgi:plastocyanin